MSEQQLHNWMQEYFSAQVKNPLLKGNLPDGLGGVLMVNTLLSKLENNRIAIANSELRARIREGRPKLRARFPSAGVNIARCKRFNTHRQTKSEG